MMQRKTVALCMRVCGDAAMDQWHDLKLPRRAYFDVVWETQPID